MGRDSLLALGLGWRFRVIDSVLGIVNQCWIHNGFWPSLILHSNEYMQTRHYCSSSQAWGRSMVMCHCDNQVVVATVGRGYCKHSAMAHILLCACSFWR